MVAGAVVVVVGAAVLVGALVVVVVLAVVANRSVISATPAPSRSSMSSVIGTCQASSGTSRTASRTASVTSKPIESSKPSATIALTKPWVAPAESARTSTSTPLSASCIFVGTGSWATAAPSSSMWSAAVFAPAEPGRSLPASASLVWSQ